MSTSQLTLYNGALRVLGQTKLASLTEDVEKRHNLDTVWDENARDNCLETGNWNFATRTQKLEYNSSISPDFGFTRAFTKPTDWLRTVQLASDEYFKVPLTENDYVDEQGYFFAHIDQVYLRFVSNDASYGYDLSLWPQSFIRFFERYMAYEMAPYLHLNEKAVDRLEKKRDDALMAALSKDALNEGVKFPPQTRWLRRRRGSSNRSDLGSRSSLTG